MVAINTEQYKQLKPEDMEAAADAAIEDLKQQVIDKVVTMEQVLWFCDWINKHKQSAGYKKVGRRLVQISKDRGFEAATVDDMVGDE